MMGSRGVEVQMKTPKDIHIIPEAFKMSLRPQTATRGSVLVYLIVVILIFGVLGVTMVSLFTTASTSSATPNDARRAYNLAESGTRYAFSELRDSDFDNATINDLNSTTYNLTNAGSFSLRVFSLWFESPSVQEGSNYTLTLNSPAGILPLGSFVPFNSNVWIINFEYLETTDDTRTRSPISAYTRVNDTTLTISVSGDFNVSTDERVIIGVMPATTQGPLATGADLYVERIAKDFFPRFNGAVNINRFNYSYERWVDEPANNRVKLENLTAFRFNNPAGAFPLTVTRTTGGTYTGDFIALSPGNYMVIPTGTSGPASYGGDYEIGMNIFDQVPPPPLPLPFDQFNIVETDPGLITLDPDDETLDIGGSYTPPVEVDFGGAWYSGDQSIGGNPNVCNTGACLFGRGIRVFFTFNYTGDGDGFTFTVINADPTDGNDITSIGGDPQGSELLAYAGDSREDPAGTTFLDNQGGRGLVPPKLAVEFDAKTNFDQNFEDEEIKNYCIGPNLRQDTRNDPLPGGAEKDAVQFVYWRDRNPIDIPCRPNGDSSHSTASYDDNRHAPFPDPASPLNERDLFLSDSELDVTPSNSWLNNGPWAVRLEVERSLVQNIDGNFDYHLRLWMRQCTLADCNDILGTSFQNTRIKYDYSALPDLPLVQNIELSESDHIMFSRFLFGFTTATAPGETQSAVIDLEQFNLSFIRPNDPVIIDDPDWVP
jgi:hypothetical protein